MKIIKYKSAMPMRSLCKIMFLGLLFSCGTHESGKENENAKPENVIELSDEQVKNIGIETVAGQLLNVPLVLKLNGRVEVPPQNMISVSVPLGGYLKSTSLLPGMHVNKGDVLAVIEDREYIQLQQDYLTAKAQLVYLESEYSRQKDLNESKASSDKIFEEVKANRQSQFVLVRSLEEKLKLTGLNPDNVTAANLSRSINIYSPISGFVSSVNVNVGKYISPSDVMFELVNPDDIHLTLTVFEKDVDKLSIGQRMHAYTNSDPSRKYSCGIILISRNLNSGNAAQVHCHFEKYDKSLLPGMFMNAEIELDSNKVFALPEQAVVRFENKHYVFVRKEKNSFEMMEVNTGSTVNGFTEIMMDEELREAHYVSRGAYNLLMVLKNTEE